MMYIDYMSIDFEIYNYKIQHEIDIKSITKENTIY